MLFRAFSQFQRYKHLASYMECSLMIGKTISHYKILEKLGEGGMGVVYKALDARLGRTVALKFLRPQIQPTETERTRLLLEARAASVINHAHVCTIHDIQEDAGQLYIVMEYIEGTILRRLLPITQLSACLEYAIQIGEALAEAHSQGIIHRDIKSENIMITAKNQVKVMDFGLAKMKGSLKLTKSSSTVGTLAYMAPEQIQESTVDARADIFSFGVVLYEMLTGHLPFHGEHEAAMIYSIVNEEPVPIQSYLTDSSSELQHILNRALEKSPADRYQSMQEMIIDLRRVKKETERVLRPTFQPVHEKMIDEVPAPRRPAGRRRVISIVMIFITVVIIGLAWRLLRDRDIRVNPDMTVHYVQIPFRNINYSAISRDGNWLVFPAEIGKGDWGVYLMNIAKSEPRMVARDSCTTIWMVNISPDASEILYTRINENTGTELVKISSLGGAGQVIFQTTKAYIIQVGWLPSEAGLYLSLLTNLNGPLRRCHELWNCHIDGTNLEFVFADTTTLVTPRQRFSYSPDGRKVVWTKNTAPEQSEIVVRDLITGRDHQLTFDEKIADDAIWGPAGRIIFSSNKNGNINLWAVPSGGGVAVQVTKGSGADYSLGTDGEGSRLFYNEDQTIGQVKLVNLADGETRQLTVENLNRGMAAISPRGGMIANNVQKGSIDSRKWDIYLMDRDGSNIRQLTDEAEGAYMPAWSPDEKWLAYRCWDKYEPLDSARIFVVSADRAGRPRFLGMGRRLIWLDEKEFVILGMKNSFLGTLDRPELQKFSEDSLNAIPVIDKKFVVLYDLHKGRTQFSIVPMEIYLTAGASASRPLIRDVNNVALARGGRELYYCRPGTYELHRISLPAGRDERLRVIPGLGSLFSVREDGAELVFTETYRQNRLVILDEPFK